MKRKLIFVGVVSLVFTNLITINIAFGYSSPIRIQNEIRDAKRQQLYYDTMMMLGADDEKETGDSNQAKQPVKTNGDICKASMGENSQYNTLLKKCECVEKYKLYNNKCISKLEYGIEYCKETIGINSKYDSEKDSCTTNEDYCKEKLGDNSRYSIANDSCECIDGFILNENTCMNEKPNDINIEQVETENKPLSFSKKIINIFQKLKFW